MSSIQNNRVYWSCKRGMLELDLILIPFFLHCYPTLSEESQQDYCVLLSATDVELYAWLTGKESPTEAKMQAMVSRIRDYALDISRARAI